MKTTRMLYFALAAVLLYVLFGRSTSATTPAAPGAVAGGTGATSPSSPIALASGISGGLSSILTGLFGGAVTSTATLSTGGYLTGGSQGPVAPISVPASMQPPAVTNLTLQSAPVDDSLLAFDDSLDPSLYADASFDTSDLSVTTD